MEICTETPKERFEKASLAMSKHCHDAGRLNYAIQLSEEDIERQKRELLNMRVDFDKINKEFRKASEEYFAAKKGESQQETTNPSMVQQ